MKGRSIYLGAMPLTSGINHVALVTADLDRLLDFYTSVFEAEVRVELVEGPVRHALIDVGGGTTLHPFEFSGRPADGPFGEMFERGHLDHVSLNVSDEDTFALLRQRLVDCDASDGTMTDFGVVRTVAYRDPDGWWGEIAIWSDGEPLPLEQAVVTAFA
jgi:catechol 2,3-dioxygenase-like lactoylglutathione lyase family enzyme